MSHSLSHVRFSYSHASLDYNLTHFTHVHNIVDINNLIIWEKAH